MVLVKAHNRWVIPFSFLFALLLCVFPVMHEARWLRPEFLALFVIYWVVTLPRTVNVLVILLIGCFQDLLEGSLIGQHGLALITVCYLCLVIEQRMRHYASWQQSLVVVIIIAAHQMVDNWIHSFLGGGAENFEFLMPALTSAMLWPIVFILLDKLRWQLRVN